MSFSEVLGQNLAITILKNGLERNRLSHAYLFSGEKGVGKSITAFEFAKSINCKEKIKDSCDQCISCRKATNNNHPDIKEIRPDGASIKIGQIRSLQQEILYKPYESKKKVYIIHQIENLRPEAGNSLLKTLEEPPDYAIIILITNNYNQVLSTIISRCQLIRFSRVPDRLIKNKLLSDHKLTAEKSKLITSLAAGCYQRALDLISDEEKMEERKYILELIISLKDSNQIRSFEVAKELLNYKDEINQILDTIATWYRDLLLTKLNQTDNLVNTDYEDHLIAEASDLSQIKIEKIIKLVEDTNNVIKRTNVNLRLTLEVMLLKLNRLRR